MMGDDKKAFLYMMAIICLFSTICFALGTYHTAQLYECRRIGMELAMSAIDIQAICK